jgi:hypothetical protein
MKNNHHIFIAMAISWLSLPAIASDFSGMMTIALGLPVMGTAVIGYGVLAAFPRLSRTVYRIAVAAFVILVLFGLLMAGDAATLSRRGHHGPMYLYFGLFGLAILCFVVVYLRHQSHREHSRKQSEH